MGLGLHYSTDTDADTDTDRDLAFEHEKLAAVAILRFNIHPVCGHRSIDSSTYYNTYAILSRFKEVFVLPISIRDLMNCRFRQTLNGSYSFT